MDTSQIYGRHSLGTRRHAGLLSGSRRQRLPVRNSALVRNQHARHPLHQVRRRNRHVPPSPPSQATTIRTADLEIDSDGQASGKAQRGLYRPIGCRPAANNPAKKMKRAAAKRIGDEIQGWLPAGSTYEVTAITDWDNKDKALHVEGTAKIPNLGTAAGRRMLVPASPFQARQTAAFPSEKRLLLRLFQLSVGGN